MDIQIYTTDTDIVIKNNLTGLESHCLLQFATLEEILNDCEKNITAWWDEYQKKIEEEE